MHNTALSFDTLQYAKRLKAVGFTEDQAEVQAEALKELIDNRLATKQDLVHLQEQLTHHINEVDTRLTHKIDDVEVRLINQINELGYKLTVRLGGMIISGVITLGAFLALIKFLA